MKKPIIECSDVSLETVGDLIGVLMKCPKDFSLHPMGVKCAVAVDYVHECVYLDEAEWIDEHASNVIDEARQISDPTEIDVPDEKLRTYEGG